MANIPSLGELTYKAQPEIGGGQPGVVIDNSNTVRALTDMANVKAQNDWNKYLLFQDNLKDVYKNLGDISGLETATQDKEYLTKQMGEIFQGIAENPRAFFSGGSKYAEIQGKIAKLRSEATESKMNQVYDFAHRQYMTQNPELNTPENQQKINSYWSQPLGKRQAYMLDMPTLFDFDTYLKGALTASATPLSDSGVVTEAGREFLKTIEGTQYSRQKFMNAWMTGLDMQQDKNGHSIRGFAQQQYNKFLQNATPEQKAQVKTVEDFWRRQGEFAFGSDKDRIDISKSELKEIDYNKEKMEIALKKLGLDAAKVGIEGKKADAYVKHMGTLDKQIEDKVKDNSTTVEKEYGDFVNNFKPGGVTISGGKKLDAIFVDQLPKSYQQIGGVSLVAKVGQYENDKGEKVQYPTGGQALQVGRIAPYKTKDGRDYYIPRYVDPQTGDKLEYNSQKLANVYNDWKKKGFVGDYDSFFKVMLKNGGVELVLQGQNGSANYTTMYQSAKAINAVGTAKGEENIVNPPVSEPESPE